MKKVLLVLLAIALSSSTMFGQLRRGAFGIQSRIDITNLASAPLTGLGIAYAMSENLRIDGSLAFGSLSSGGNSSSEFGFAAAAAYYIGTVDNVSAFAGGKIGFTSFSPGGGASSTTGFNIGGFYGAEYWFSPKFAWSGMMGLQFTSTSSNGQSGSAFSTFGPAGSTGLTWWFN